jgi:hypothetical protein
MPNDSTLSRAWLLGLCCLGLTACQAPPTQVDQYFGLAVQKATMQQTQNWPMARCEMGHAHGSCEASQQGRHHPHGMSAHPAPRDSDGESAQSAIQRYQDSFVSPSATSAGTSVSAGSLIKR